MSIYKLTYLLSILTIGLMAGLFYNWSFNITSGLNKVDDKTYLQVMQTFNRSILNPAFFFIFVGSIISMPFLTFLQAKTGWNPSMWLIVSAVIIYFVGSIVTTFFRNVPMNNQLEALNLNEISLDECQAFRETFETRWNRLNWLRTISSLTSFILLLIPMLFPLNE